MATEIVRWCDLDLDLDKRVPGETILMSLDGKSLDLDLCEAHEAELRRLLEPYVSSGRLVPAGKSPKAPEGRRCPVCGHRVGTASGLRLHVINKHPDQVTTSPDFTCPDCNRQFANGTGLSAHRRAAHASPGGTGRAA